MQQLFYFIQRHKNFLFFLLLEFVALFLIINNHNFHKNKFVSSTNFITGFLYEQSSEVFDYFHLKYQNEQLINENLTLKKELEKKNFYKKNKNLTLTVNDTINFHQKYTYTNAKVINNNYQNLYNFITINKGEDQGIACEMGVINSRGIIGIIDNTSNRYARVQSILNRNSKINARLKNSFYFGTLIWNGKNYQKVQLTDIPRQAIVKLHDTVITGGKSTIFPEGIPIGTVVHISKKNNIINIQLFNDMSNLGYIYIIKNLEKKEIKNLETIEK